jgi:hypothetical protein
MTSHLRLASVTVITALYRESAHKLQERSSTGIERSCSIPSPRNTSVSAARVINLAIGLVEQQEERLRDILESKQATPDEKFEALVNLANLAGIVLHKAAEVGRLPD